MRTLLVLALVAASTATASAQGFGVTGLLPFNEKCASCHVNPEPGSRAPTRAQLQGQPPEAILAAMTTGGMAPMASGLTEAQMRAIAEYVSGRSFGTATAGHASTMKNQCAREAAGQSAGRTGLERLGRRQVELALPAGGGRRVDRRPRCPKLTLKWAFGFPEGRQAFGQPTVVGGRIYVGSDNGFVYSLDAASGCVYWSYQAKAGVRTAITVAPIKAGASRFAVFFGDVRANVYAIDAENAALIWTKHADPHPVARITGAPAFHDGRLYVPVSSIEEAMGGNPAYPCCSFRGSVIAYDASTGEQRWQSFTISEAAVPMRKTSTGTQLWGPAGAAVWSAPTIDPERGRIYLSTSNGYTYPAVNTTDAVMAVDLATGKRLWTRQLTPNDAYVIGCGPNAKSETCPQETGPDFAVGTSPILRTLAGGRRILAVGQKSGIAWGIDPDDGTVVWQHRVGQGTPLGGIEWGGAADDRFVYYPNADGLLGMKAAGGLAAIRLATGEREWWAPPIATCPDQTMKCIPAQSAAASLIPGVVFSGATDGMMRAYGATDGKVLWEFATAREFETVNGVKARGGSINGPGATIVNGMVFTNSGYGSFGQMAGNVLLAFGVQ